MRRAPLALVLFLASCSCESSLKVTGHTPDGGTDAGTGGGTDGGSTDGGLTGLEVTPSAPQALAVTRGMTAPTVVYSATLDGQPVAVGWVVDRPDIAGTAPSSGTTSTVSPTGTTGGSVVLSARLSGMVVKRHLFIALEAGAQNGKNPTDPEEALQIPASPADLKAGGGVGGVGGEGLGDAVTTPATLQLLNAPTGDGQAQALKLLYPYDATVWPRGMLAPLLMWSSTLDDVDAIKLELSTTSGAFHWSGTFSRPAILATTGGHFIRHPIPQDIWRMATDSAGGADKLILKLTLARGAAAYGPISQTWTVAPARLTGTVYYNSYGTQLVKNWVSGDSAGHPVGAAILGIRSGDTAPKLIIGQNSPLGGNGLPTDDSGCRVCHTVASRGRWLITQSESGSPGDGTTWLYDLQAANIQASAVALPKDGTFAWSAMTGDGGFVLTNTVDPSSSNPAIAGASASTAVSSFWQFGPVPVMQTLTGLPAGFAAGYPGYSPDDTKVAFINATGHNRDLVGLPLMVADYNPSTHAFSNLSTVYTPPADQRVGYPAFLPDNTGLVFEHEVRGGGDSVVTTRDCARSELWWAKLGVAPIPLALANGKAGAASYLPVGGKNHGIYEPGDPRCGADDSVNMFDDTTLAYEPTILPVVVGGYAWLVFTSRRMYGNQLTYYPWNSWPPDFDTTNLSVSPTKKLWVVAIDLNAPDGADPSHPAFYLPAQEILAGNSRGFFVLDPCKQDGTDCTSGDQCCNGFCQPDPMQVEGLVCTSTATCAGLQEHCTTAANCCDMSNLCINGFCAGPTIN